MAGDHRVATTMKFYVGKDAEWLARDLQQRYGRPDSEDPFNSRPESPRDVHPPAAETP